MLNIQIRDSEAGEKEIFEFCNINLDYRYGWYKYVTSIIEGDK